MGWDWLTGKKEAAVDALPMTETCPGEQDVPTTPLRPHATGVPTTLTVPLDPRDPRVPLTAPQREYLGHLLGAFRSYAEIQDAFLLQDWPVPTQRQIATCLRAKDLKPFIQSARLAYLNQTLAVPIAHKVVRMERLEPLYHRALTKGNDFLANRHLVAAREEMEKVLEGTHVYINQNILQLDAAGLQRRQQEIMERMKTINTEVVHAQQ